MTASRRMLLAAVIPAAATLLAAAPAAAQGFAAAVRPVAIAHATPSVGDARRLVQEGRWKEARSAFGAIVDDARTRGEYAKDALLELARLRYMMDDVRGAAQTYEELGAQAETYGDPATELEARFDAAILYQEAHDRVAMSPQLKRVQQLLKSPAIGDSLKETVSSRIKP